MRQSSENVRLPSGCTPAHGIHHSVERVSCQSSQYNNADKTHRKCIMSRTRWLTPNTGESIFDRLLENRVDILGNCSRDHLFGACP